MTLCICNRKALTRKAPNHNVSIRYIFGIYGCNISEHYVITKVFSIGINSIFV